MNRASAALLLLSAGVAGCSMGSPAAVPEEPGGSVVLAEAGGAGEVPAVERLRLEVVEVYDHDPTSFTQGLVWHDGLLYESTGRYGESEIIVWSPDSGEVDRRVALPESLFGEGLALAGDRLLQLSWRDGRALVWNLALERVDEYRYDGEGWGLASNGSQLVMSDGTAILAFRDPDSFRIKHLVEVTLEGRPHGSLNELEWVGDSIYANVWTTDTIVRIDPLSGRVTAVIDASGLLQEEERRGTDVLNGIAYRADRGTFLVTGKLWPKLFEVEIVGD